MRIRLRGSAPTPEQQRANDTHRPITLVAFAAVILAYAYCFTHIADTLGLPMPQEAAERMGIDVENVFDVDGNVDSRLHVQATSRFNSDDERLILFAILTGAFLCVYFLPLDLKRPSCLVWFLIGFVAVYGLHATIIFATAHFAVYLIFHPSARDVRLLSAVFGVSVPLSFLYGSGVSAENTTLLAVGTGALFRFFYGWAFIPLLEHKTMGMVARRTIIHAPLVFGICGAFSEAQTGNEWPLAIGLLFFLWQWERLMVYHADYRDGEVAKDLPLFEYLSVFMSPAVIPNFRYAPYVGQSYAYLRSKFFCEDKNLIIAAGLRIWVIALVYLVMCDWLVDQIVAGAKEYLGVTVYPFTNALVREYVRGTEMSTATVLLSTFLDQSRIFLAYGAVTHFRVGAWRVMGYQMDPQYNRPWLSTNLVTFWGRFAYHYREYLVRCFYYPIFFRFFKKRKNLRLFAATMGSAALGNLIWGHIPDRMYSRGMTWDLLVLMLQAWPYYLLLGLSISLTQLYLLRKKRSRQPWTFDRRFVLDILAAYCTMQFFSLIHIFARPHPEGSLVQYIELFMKGFGISA